MNLAQTSSHGMEYPSIPSLIACIFVVDNDISVRKSLELLIRCEGWQPETFQSALRISLIGPRLPRPELSHPRSRTPRPQRTRTAKNYRARARRDADHLHVRLRRYSNNGKGQ